MQNKKWIVLIIFGLMITCLFPLLGYSVKADVNTTVTYRFSGLKSDGWTYNPSYMYDTSNTTYSSTGTNEQYEVLGGTNCTGTDLGTIVSVHFRTRGYYTGSGVIHWIVLWINNGDFVSLTFNVNTFTTWSSWVDCTTDVGIVGNNWNYIKNANCTVLSQKTGTVSLYCSIVEFRVTYVKPSSVLSISETSVYPVNNSYTYPKVTLSWNITSGSNYNYSLYQKIGVGSFYLVETKTNQPLGTTTFYKRWFNATSINTLYQWKVCIKNFTINNWKNYSFKFYINDTTVHLSDTKTNVYGTLTYTRNNTGYYILSNHNSSITPKIKTVNSTLIHQYYWVTNTWIDYINSTGNKTTCGSTNLTLYDNSINCSGTIQTNYNILNGWSVFVNKTGNTSIGFIPNIKIFLSNFSGGVIWNGTYSFTTTNISFNASSNVTEYGNISINGDDYFLSGILTFDNPQFFFVVLIIIWLMIVFKYIDNRKNESSSILAWLQFGIAIPLTIFVFSLSYLQAQPFGYIIGFLIPIVSLYILADRIFYKKT